MKYEWWNEVKKEIIEYPRTNSPYVSKALEFLRQTPEGIQAIRLLELKYFSKRHYIVGAAALLGIPERTAARRIEKAFKAVANEMGLYLNTTRG